MSDRTPTAFGQRLLAAAAYAQFTQTALGRALGLHPGRMSKLIYRPFAAVDLEVIRRIRDVTLVCTDWLLWGDGPMFPPVPSALQKAQQRAMRSGIPYEAVERAKEAAADDLTVDFSNEHCWRVDGFRDVLSMGWFQRACIQKGTEHRIPLFTRYFGQVEFAIGVGDQHTDLLCIAFLITPNDKHIFLRLC
jgi:hypothetical protein